jgi:CrcB protein
VVGILGSFTTFSTFSLDVIVLFERGDYLSAMFYIIASVVLSVGAFFGAMFIFRHILA